MTIRVLYVIDTLEIGGTEKSLLDLCGTISRDQINPIVCQLYPGSALRSQFESLGVPCHCLNIKSKYGFRQAYRLLRDVIQSSRIDIIHTMLFRAGQVGRFAGRRMGIPVVSSFTGAPWDPIRYQLNPSLSRWKSRCLRQLDRWSAQWVRQFHAVSQHARDSNCAALGIPADKVTIIGRGRDVGLTAIDDAEADRLRRELGLDRDGPVITYVSRLIPGKGHDVLLRAIPLLRQHYPDAQLLIVGDGPKRQSLEQLAAELNIAGEVRFAGWRDDVPKVLQISDLFVFPSANEGMPGALIEAMLAGLPIAASRIPAVEEIVEDQRTGKLFDATSAREIAQSVDSLLSDPAKMQAMGSAARELAAGRFDQRVVAREMQALYASVVGSEE